MQNAQAQSVRAGAPLLRGLVLLLALLEISLAGYVCYALYFDDTTSWIGTVLEGVNDLWQALVLPMGGAGILALVLGAANRLLWIALLVTLAAPAVSVWLLLG